MVERGDYWAKKMNQIMSLTSRVINVEKGSERISFRN